MFRSTYDDIKMFHSIFLVVVLLFSLCGGDEIGKAVDDYQIIKDTVGKAHKSPPPK